jgi:P27 family predicted phage terminase small subunit|tara:strand:- start:69 stop:545 length:477 start_codon:yes stop_codon:yes gene_type:complete
MGKGRKKLPTAMKEMQGTLEKSRVLENEMQVDLVSQLPEAPELLSTIGVEEWYKVTSQLFNLKMLHHIDLRLIESYCNEMALYIECESELRKNGRVDIFKNTNGDIIRSQAKPYVKMKNDALNNALKLAAQFGLTPVARANISAPLTTNNTQINNYFD